MGWASTKEDIEAYRVDLGHMWSRWEVSGIIDASATRKLIQDGEALVRRLGELLEIADSAVLEKDYVIWEARARGLVLEREVEQLRATNDTLNKRLSESRAEDQRTIDLLRRELGELSLRKHTETLKARARRSKKKAERSHRQKVRRLLELPPFGAVGSKQRGSVKPATKAGSKPRRSQAKAKAKKGARSRISLYAPALAR